MRTMGLCALRTFSTFFSAPTFRPFSRTSHWTSASACAPRCSSTNSPRAPSPTPNKLGTCPAGPLSCPSPDRIDCLSPAVARGAATSFSVPTLSSRPTNAGPPSRYSLTLAPGPSSRPPPSNSSAASPTRCRPPLSLTSPTTRHLVVVHFPASDQRLIFQPPSVKSITPRSTNALR